MRFEGDHLIFATGKRVYVFDGKIGLAESPWSIGFGSDGAIAIDQDPNLPFNDECLSSAEQCELADYMIDRWQSFKASIAG